MNKKIIAGISAFVLCSSVLTVTAATTKNNPLSAAMQSLQNQLQANKKAENDIINQAKQSDAYKQLQAKEQELQKSIIDQQVKDGKLTADQASKLKNQIDARTKMASDTDLQNLMKNTQTYMSDFRTLAQKYTDNKTLIASQEFKDLKAKIVTNEKAVIDRLAADGVITSDEATKQKANIDTISTNIDNGKANIMQLFMGAMNRGNGMGFGGQMGRGMDHSRGYGKGGGMGYGMGSGMGCGGYGSGYGMHQGAGFRGRGFNSNSSKSGNSTNDSTNSTNSGTSSKTAYKVVTGNGTSL